MTRWQQLFVKSENSGIYTAGPDEAASVPKAAGKAGLAFFRLDAAGVKGKHDFLKAAARALQFPAYFGSNWDAFEDCLTDLSWQQAIGYVLLLENLNNFADHAPAEMNQTRSILQDAAEYWKGQGVRFFVILTDRDRRRSPMRARP
jgi:hypothetical protein